MSSKQHIFLTGFMGSGKSTHGKKLASLMNMTFVDLDQCIESIKNKTVQQIFEEEGEEAFRETERDCLLEVVSRREPGVVSLGGGTICFYNNLELVKNNGTLIYIELPPAALCARIGNSAQPRPLLKGLSGEALLKSITEKLEARKRYYGQAHITLNGLNLTAQQIYSEVVAFRQENNG